MQSSKNKIRLCTFVSVGFVIYRELEADHLWLLMNFTEQERDCDICGVEITENAVAVNEHPFKRSTAFLLGNEVRTIICFGFFLL